MFFVDATRAFLDFFSFSQTFDAFGAFGHASNLPSRRAAKTWKAFAETLDAAAVEVCARLEFQVASRQWSAEAASKQCRCFFGLVKSGRSPMYIQ
jgi:hypothetical protein